MGEDVRTTGRKDFNEDTYYEGEMINGIPDGQGEYHFKDGFYTGEFKAGKYDGKGTMTFNEVPAGTLPFDNGTYDMRPKYTGTWKDNKKVGNFILSLGSLDYDKVYKDDKEVPCRIRFDIESDMSEVEEGTLKIYHCGQSGFIIETAEATLIFDWYRASMPELNKEKPIYVFISHVHNDHFSFRIFELAKMYKNVKFYVGFKFGNKNLEIYDKTFKAMPQDIDDCIEFFDGEEILDTEFGCVHSLRSTDLGVAFLIDINGLRFYHAGDLAWLNAFLTMAECKRQLLEKNKDSKPEDFPADKVKKSYEGFCSRMKIKTDEGEFTTGEMFANYAEPLAGEKIDFAMLPMDPRFGYFGYYTVDHYLGTADIKKFIPMHLWNKYEFVEGYTKVHPQVVENMIAVKTDNLNVKQSFELWKPFRVSLKD